MTLPQGYPPQGTLSSSRTPALTVCEAPGCMAGVTVIVLHTVETEDHQIHTFCHQLCDQHASENEETLRSIYTVKPVGIIWR